ncbi:hypothetical protein N7499_004300 [Penicillium canescens]|nr:hypothetical protein N7522_013973 [Penicillium canescens]KAJ6088118.1 hypothetical protein N7499_004300 [Penicillium canescens]KAJ6181376.1 hypothetical protein N7485_000018 [Penicillium canescens]
MPALTKPLMPLVTLKSAFWLLTNVLANRVNNLFTGNILRAIEDILRVIMWCRVLEHVEMCSDVADVPRDQSSQHSNRQRVS